MFQHLLREESIKVHLDVPNREAALAELIAILPSWGVTSKQKGSLLELLLQRERFGTTAIGDGIALPHCVFSGISYPLASLGLSRKGIPYPSLDGEPVNLVFLAVFPDHEEYSHSEKRRDLHDAENFFRDRFLRERLKISESPEEAYEIILRESRYLSENLGITGRK